MWPTCKAAYRLVEYKRLIESKAQDVGLLGYVKKVWEGRNPTSEVEKVNRGRIRDVGLLDNVKELANGLGETWIRT